MGNVRVRGHDYHGRGYYFITFGTFKRYHWLSHIECGRVVLEPTGNLLLQAWRKIAEEDPAYELGVTAVMPDHFHGMAIARENPKCVIGTHVSRVKGRVLHAMRKQIANPELKIWDDGFYDYLALDMKMLRAFENYIADNPIRWQLRIDNPQWFRKQYALHHPRLPQHTTWTAYGDATLLNHPSLVPVIISTRVCQAEQDARIAEIMDQVQQGAIPVGGFISPGEHRVAEEVVKLPRSRLMKLVPWGLNHYKPQGSTAARWLAGGRTLILSGFPDHEPPQCRRVNCLQNNAWAREIAACPAGALAPRISPSSAGALAPRISTKAPPP